MKEIAFWCFFTFGGITVFFALIGAWFAWTKTGGPGSSILGFLMLFLGASLAFMLGSLLFIRTKEGKR